MSVAVETVQLIRDDEQAQAIIREGRQMPYFQRFRPDAKGEGMVIGMGFRWRGQWAYGLLWYDYPNPAANGWMVARGQNRDAVEKVVSQLLENSGTEDLQWLDV